MALPHHTSGRLSVRTITFLSLGCALILGIAYFIFLRTSSVDQSFALQYQKTYALLKTFEPALFLPGSGSNVVRQDLNNILTSILTDTKLSDADRLALSERGIVQLSVFDKQIKTAERLHKDFGNAAGDLSQSLQRVTSNKKTAEELVLLFKTYDDNSKKALDNLDTMHTSIEDIFMRVRKDGGSLTQEHITELNARIPETEKTFDSLFALYQDLEKTKKNIDQTSEKLFPPSH